MDPFGKVRATGADTGEASRRSQNAVSTLYGAWNPEEFLVFLLQWMENRRCCQARSLARQRARGGK